MNRSKAFASVALFLLGINSMLLASRNNGKEMARCGEQPTPPAPCNQDACYSIHCMGPENYGVNAAVNPRTCNGNWVINIQGFYWNAHQEGLDYVIVNDLLESSWRLNMNYINAEMKGPNFDWDFGFKLGIGFDTTCDGWDLGVVWTWYRGKAKSHIETETSDNRIMLAFLSNFGDPQVFPLATDAAANWRLELNLVDIELGRQFWNSKRLALRPFIGFRYASLKQDYNVEYKGGSFTMRPNPNFISVVQNDYIDFDNDFSGFGIRGGLSSVWNLGCGWGIYGNLALSTVYGRFDIDIDEETRDAQFPYIKSKFTEFEKHFCATRFMTDVAIGVQWSSLFCDCQYGFTIALGWEHHMFLNQNQLYRLNHKFETLDGGVGDVINPQIDQMRGDLDTQGWTLSVTFDF